MLRRNDLARIISDRFSLRGGRRIPIYLGEWMIDYVFEAIKIALIEDGSVNIKNYMSFKRIDIPKHDHRMPDGAIATIPPKAKIRVEYKENFMKDINNSEIKELDYASKKKFQ